MVTALSSGRRFLGFGKEARRPSHGPLIPAGYDHLAFATRGTFSEIHLVQDCQSGRLCALKQLRTEWMDDPTARRLLHNGACVARKVVSAYVPRFVDAELDGGRPYCAQEWIAGENLADTLKHEGPLPVARALWIARQCALGLKACHTAGYSHGDLEPSNVLVTDAGEAKLVGLGHSRPLETAGDLQGADSSADSRSYASSSDAGHRTSLGANDIFDLGVTLSWMLTGRSPLGESPGTRLLYESRQAEHLRPETCCPPVSPALVKLVNCLLSEAPIHLSISLDTVIRELIDLELAALGQSQAA